MHFNSLRIKGKVRMSDIPSKSILYTLLKRMLDLSIMLLGLLFISPCLLLIAILIKFDSKGPAFIKTKRIGLKGGILWYYKFRTFDVANEENNKRPMQKKECRITRMGRFLRQTGLDELPALLNVVTGDMSIVGRSFILDDSKTSATLSEKEKEALLKIKPGFVSLWALSENRIHITLDNIFDYDMYYLMNRSLSLDIKMIFGSMIQTLGLSSKF